MSTIPLLAGLTGVALASGLTALAITEAQFQHSALQVLAEASALAVAEDAFATVSGSNPGASLEQQRLSQLALTWLPRLDQRQRRKVSVVAYSPDGRTVRVELCEAFDSWHLPWLGRAIGNPKVCAAANARAVS